jgi:hypothetical protein
MKKLPYFIFIGNGENLEEFRGCPRISPKFPNYKIV